MWRFESLGLYIYLRVLRSSSSSLVNGNIYNMGAGVVEAADEVEADCGEGRVIKAHSALISAIVGNWGVASTNNSSGTIGLM